MKAYIQGLTDGTGWNKSGIVCKDSKDGSVYVADLGSLTWALG